MTCAYVGNATRNLVVAESRRQATSGAEQARLIRCRRHYGPQRRRGGDTGGWADANASILAHNHKTVSYLDLHPLRLHADRGSGRFRRVVMLGTVGGKWLVWWWLWHYVADTHGGLWAAFGVSSTLTCHNGCNKPQGRFRARSVVGLDTAGGS